MWTKPKPIIVEDAPKQIYKKGQATADIRVCTSYSTGEPLFYVASVIHYHSANNSAIPTTSNDYALASKDCALASIKDYAFMTLEEAMVFCDLHDIYVDTSYWSTLGLLSFYTFLRVIRLENGSTYVLPDGA